MKTPPPESDRDTIRLSDRVELAYINVLLDRLEADGTIDKHRPAADRRGDALVLALQAADIIPTRNEEERALAAHVEGIMDQIEAEGAVALRVFVRVPHDHYPAVEEFRRLMEADKAQKRRHKKGLLK